MFVGVQTMAEADLLLPQELVLNTPSRQDGVTAETETLYRFLGCQLIAEAGALLKVPQVVVATAQTAYQRLYFRRSFKSLDAHHVALACIFLAGKVEENTRQMRDVINSVWHVKERWQCIQRTGQPPAQGLARQVQLGGQAYINWKTALIRCERMVLKELGFSMYSISEGHPHRLLLFYLRALGCTVSAPAPAVGSSSDAQGSSSSSSYTPSAEDNQLLASLAWAACNDSLRTDLCVRAAPDAIACACIYLASRQWAQAKAMMAGVAGGAVSATMYPCYPLPTASPWWAVFTPVPFESLQDMSEEICAVQSRVQPPVWPASLRPDWKPSDDEE